MAKLTASASDSNIVIMFDISFIYLKSIS